jgi:hypothetical protein
LRGADAPTLPAYFSEKKANRGRYYHSLLQIFFIGGLIFCRAFIKKMTVFLINPFFELVVFSG